MKSFMLLFQHMLDQVSNEGVKVLSLSELQGSTTRGLGAEFAELKQAWSEERESLVSAVHALKELLSETQKTADTSKVSHHRYTLSVVFCMLRVDFRHLHVHAIVILRTKHILL